MEERPNYVFLWIKDNIFSTLLTCYVAMETRKVILCGGISIQVLQLSYNFW